MTRGTARSDSEFNAAGLSPQPKGDPSPANPGASQAVDPLDTAIRKARAAQAQVTKLQRSRATGFRIGQQVTINAPKSPRYHRRVGEVEATNLGEVQVLGAWFLPTELERVR